MSSTPTQTTEIDEQTENQTETSDVVDVAASSDELIVCGCHERAFRTYADFYEHTNGTYPDAISAEADADVVEDRDEFESTYGDDAMVVGEVRDLDGVSVCLPADVVDAGAHFVTGFVRGYAARMNGGTKSRNLYAGGNGWWEDLWNRGWELADSELDSERYPVREVDDE